MSGAEFIGHPQTTGDRHGPINSRCDVKDPMEHGKLVGQMAPLKLKDIWAIRVRLQVGRRIRELALFNLAIDSKLRSCDL
jgi:hypothetical protein